MINVIPNGSKAKVALGFEQYTEVEIISFSSKRNRLGHKGNYKVRIIGGVDIYGNRAKVGSIQEVLHSNVIDAR